MLTRYRAVLAASLWVAAMLCLDGCQRLPSTAVAEGSEYHAVLLSNGQILVGRIDKLGSPYPTLTDVFYIQTVNDPDKKQPRSILVKRGKEWHAPEKAILNANHILMVEPIGRDSKLMAMMAAARRQ